MGSLTRNCSVCRMEISNFAKICPHCRYDPFTSLESQKAEERRNQQQREKIVYVQNDETSHGFDSSNVVGCLGVLAVIAIIGAIVSFFEWMGARISLRFGSDYLPIASVILVIWMIAGAAIAWRGVDKDMPPLKTWGTLGAWFAAMVLILFLPDSLALQPAPKLSGTEQTGATAGAPVASDSTPANSAIGQPLPTSPVTNATSSAADAAAASAEAAAGQSEPSVSDSATPSASGDYQGSRAMADTSTGEKVRRETYFCGARGESRYLFELTAPDHTSYGVSDKENYDAGSIMQSFDTYKAAVAAVCSVS